MFTDRTTAQTGTGTSDELSLSRSVRGRTSLTVVVTGDATFTVQHSLGDGVWFDHDSLAAVTGNQDGNYVLPIASVRLNVTAITTGDVYLRIVGV